MQAPGGLNVSEHLRTLDTGAWSAFPRRRRYFMTLPESEDIDIVPPTKRDVPWEPGWGPIPSAVRSPMLCSRDNTNPRASTIQYHAQSLVYRYAENGNGFDWHARPERHVRAEIIRTMPDELKALYGMLLRGRMTNADENRMGQVIGWIHPEAPTLGYRVPAPTERARATGRAHYLNEFGLNDVQLYNAVVAVGNHFDPDASRARIRGPLNRVARNRTGLRHQYRTLADSSIMCLLVAREVSSIGIPVAPSPFAPDLARILTATRRSSYVPTSNARPCPAQQQTAAEYGCHNQWQCRHPPRSWRCSCTPRARTCCLSPNQELGSHNAAHFTIGRGPANAMIE